MFLSTQILAHLATTLIINFRESTHLFRQHRLKSPGRFGDEPQFGTKSQILSPTIILAVTRRPRIQARPPITLK